MPDEPDPTASPSPIQEIEGLAKWQRLLTITAALLALFAVVAILILLGRAIHHTLLLFALGGLVAYALEPLVAFAGRIRLGSRGLGRTPSVLLVFVALATLLVGGVWWLGGKAAHQTRILQKDAPRYRERAIALAHDFDAEFLKPRGVDFSVEETLQKPPPEVDAYAQRLGREALPILARSFTDVVESLIVLLIALYFLIFGSEMKERANHALSPALRRVAVPWEEDVDRILGGFVRGQLLVALITGAGAAIGLLLLGVHLWLIIGAFVALASLIPVFGPYVGAIPAILAALIGPTHLSPVGGAIAVLILFVVLTEVGSKILYPRLVGRALNLHEVVVLFVLFAGLEVGGITGTLFAAPVASLAIVTLVHLYRLWQGLPEQSIAELPASRVFKDAREP